MIPPEYQPLKYVTDKMGLTWDDEEGLVKTIAVRQKRNMYLYNYRDLGIVPRNHPIVIICRGLVIDSKGRILNYPFNRFFNHNEDSLKSEIDWDHAMMQEKVDGSLVCLWYDPNFQEWEVSTRGSFYPNPNADTDFASIFWDLFEKIRTVKLHQSRCYMFELTSRKNRVVKLYHSDGLYLIGVRDLNTLKEFPASVLDYTVDCWNCRDCYPGTPKVMRPRAIPTFYIDHCLAMFRNLAPDDEGFVVCDEKFNRIKVKQESYLKLAKIKQLSDQDILDYVLGKLEVDPEVIATFPDVSARLDHIRKTYSRVYSNVKVVLTTIGHENEQKEFALAALTYPFKSWLFSMHNKKPMARILWKDLEAWDKWFQERETHVDV